MSCDWREVRKVCPAHRSSTNGEMAALALSSALRRRRGSRSRHWCMSPPRSSPSIPNTCSLGLGGSSSWTRRENMSAGLLGLVAAQRAAAREPSSAGKGGVAALADNAQNANTKARRQSPERSVCAAAPAPGPKRSGPATRLRSRYRFGAASNARRGRFWRAGNGVRSIQRLWPATPIASSLVRLGQSVRSQPGCARAACWRRATAARVKSARD